MTRNQKIDAALNTVRAALYWTAAGLAFACIPGWWRFLVGCLTALMGIAALDTLCDALKEPEQPVRLVKARTVAPPPPPTGGKR